MYLIDLKSRRPLRATTGTRIGSRIKYDDTICGKNKTWIICDIRTEGYIYLRDGTTRKGTGDSAHSICIRRYVKDQLMASIWVSPRAIGATWASDTKPCHKTV